jgi:hypothetical protein
MMTIVLVTSAVSGRGRRGLVGIGDVRGAFR